MSVLEITTSPQAKPNHESSARLPGHWLLARLGKKVLRPGGLELTGRLLKALSIGHGDQVVEFAPGLGVTARKILGFRPAAYIGVERDANAAEKVRGRLAERGSPRTARRVVRGEAACTGLPDQCATVVVGEAMLTMQRPEEKRRIVAEAARILKPGGRYGIHEIALTPAGAEPEKRLELARDLAKAIHHGVAPLAAEEWKALLEEHGLRVIREDFSPMRLLNPVRVSRDEGPLGAARFAFNLLRDREARARVRKMRGTFRRHRYHMEAIMLIAEKAEERNRG